MSLATDWHSNDYNSENHRTANTRPSTTVVMTYRVSNDRSIISCHSFPLIDLLQVPSSIFYLLAVNRICWIVGELFLFIWCTYLTAEVCHRIWVMSFWRHLRWQSAVAKFFSFTFCFNTCSRRGPWANSWVDPSSCNLLRVMVLK